MSEWQGGVVGTHQNEFEEGPLVHFEELLVPDGDVIRPFLLVLVIFGGRGIIFVVGAPLDHL